MIRFAITTSTILWTTHTAAPEQPAALGSVLRVVANDYAFTMSAPVRAGLVIVRLLNQGHEMHHLELSPVPESLSLRRYYELATGGQPSPLIHDVGGPNLTAPGDSSEVLIRLAPGRYILTCWVNATDGKPHIMRGMMREIRLGERTESPPPPTPTVTISASDYSFALQGRLRAGTNHVRFENRGPQEHDIQFVRLSPDQTGASIREWARKGGLGGPPSVAAGGSTGIDKGKQVWFTVTLRPGRYAVFCFVPDVHDGKMHLLHGMLREITVS
ncbi:MAG: hypothetical protein U9Q74_05630 [Gemmatimonadota bacterium]|nr:hypothetical protein [Gemmatimonadota bacterium]